MRFHPGVLLALSIGLAGLESCVGQPPPHAASCQAWLPAMDVPSSVSLTDNRGLLVVGGPDSPTMTMATWQWSGACWTERNKTDTPSRSLPALANDPSGKGIVLYGGWDTQVLDSYVGRYETWAFRDANWTQMSFQSSPKLDGPSAVNVGASVLVVGAGPSELEESWLLTTSGWVQRHPTHAPSRRFDPSLAKDPSTGNVVMYGGATQLPNTIVTDTWVWDGSDWRMIGDSLHSGSYPVAGLLAADHHSVFLFAFDPISRQVEVWRLLQGQWNRVRAPSSPKVIDFSVAFDGTRILLFGGLDESTHPGDFSTAEWSWDGSHWTRLH